MLPDTCDEIESILKDLKVTREACSKVFEKIAYNEMDKYINWQRIISEDKLVFALFKAEYESKFTIQELEEELKKYKEDEKEKMKKVQLKLENMKLM